jgi:hypothetical protein
MVTKKKIITLLLENIVNGDDMETAAQHCFKKLCDEYQIVGWKERSNILHGILFFAGELAGKSYGYEVFDLIMSRAYPNLETFENIKRQEGRNIFD